ncbi:MAG: 5'(3')-deoxyribonucleotidase [Saprospiraceae bacterium]|nr:5'(3')-deoxyribonucleotidase [Saprospiraceae bacterium]
MRKRIALDMDEVIADIEPKFLDLYERELGKKLTKADLHGKKVYHFEGAKHVRRFLFDKGFFRDLGVVPDSQEVVAELMEHYDVFITTAAMEFRNCLEDKYDWLKEHFPKIHWKNFVFCGDKSILRADYMIDDHVHNLRSFTGKGLLFSASHNMNSTEFTRVNNWLEVRDFFRAERAKE